MKTYEASEQAYKNGYELGKKAKQEKFAEQFIKGFNDATSTEELKPCPLCKGEAEFVLEGRVVGRIRCKKCGITQSVLKLKADAIKNWNRRDEGK